MRYIRTGLSVRERPGREHEAFKAVCPPLPHPQGVTHFPVDVVDRARADRAECPIGRWIGPLVRRVQVPISIRDHLAFHLSIVLRLTLALPQYPTVNPPPQCARPHKGHFTFSTTIVISSCCGRFPVKMLTSSQIPRISPSADLFLCRAIASTSRVSPNSSACSFIASVNPSV